MAAACGRGFILSVSDFARRGLGVGVPIGRRLWAEKKELLSADSDVSLVMGISIVGAFVGVIFNFLLSGPPSRLSREPRGLIGCFFSAPAEVDSVRF